MQEETEQHIQIVGIRKEPIELYQLLKIENLVQSGGEAKFVIGEGLVRVNNSVETRKRKKIMTGDTVTFNGDTIQVAVRQ